MLWDMAARDDNAKQEQWLHRECWMEYGSTDVLMVMNMMNTRGTFTTDRCRLGLGD